MTRNTGLKRGTGETLSARRQGDHGTMCAARRITPASFVRDEQSGGVEIAHHGGGAEDGGQRV
ncbi:hypothetical protein [Streptomyces mirabilis]